MCVCVFFLFVKWEITRLSSNGTGGKGFCLTCAACCCPLLVVRAAAAAAVECDDLLRRSRYGFRKPPHLELKARPKLGEREVTLIHVTDWIEKKLDQEFQVFNSFHVSFMFLGFRKQLHITTLVETSNLSHLSLPLCCQKIFVMPNMDDVWLAVMHSAMDQRTSGGSPAGPTAEREPPQPERDGTSQP